ncbi:hypothetical protein BaRGS_00014064 [Batillaria attramentaria]|uniref:Uncharacterized protein n=1 Tax=Batillaria attramentaria TaxID=370345 RepID=A0ABD0L549_9CAEN
MKSASWHECVFSTSGTFHPVGSSAVTCTPTGFSRWFHALCGPACQLAQSRTGTGVLSHSVVRTTGFYLPPIKRVLVLREARMQSFSVSPT